MLKGRKNRLGLSAGYAFRWMAGRGLWPPFPTIFIFWYDAGRVDISRGLCHTERLEMQVI
jgi:hypothetical protein